MKTHELAKSLNEKQIQNIIGGWEQRGEAKKLADFKCLVRLGDSEALAIATVLNNYNEDNSKFYKSAYENQGGEKINTTEYGKLMMKLQMSQTALLTALLQEDKNTKQIKEIADSIADLIGQCKEFLE